MRDAHMLKQKLVCTRAQLGAAHSSHDVHDPCLSSGDAIAEKLECPKAFRFYRPPFSPPLPFL